LRYPPYYVEPVLTVVSGQDNVGGLGVLYARTVPIETEGKIVIIVQISAPFVLFATASIVKLVLAHEFLHYLDLIGKLSSMAVTSELTSSYVFEERFVDSERISDAYAIFGSNKRFARQLSTKMASGLEDNKMNDKCRKSWVEKGLPMVRLPLGLNQVTLNVEAVVNSQFDPKAREVALRIRSK
jgi:hypothetical protein